MPLSKSEALSLLAGLKRGDTVVVTADGRENTVTVQRELYHPDGFGHTYSQQVMVGYGPGRWNTAISPSRIADGFIDIRPISDVSDIEPRQDEDGTPYLSYFVREPVMASFCWSGRPDQPIEVAYAEAGEPIDAQFAAWGALLEAGTVSELLTKFQQQCNEHLAHINKEDA